MITRRTFLKLVAIALLAPPVQAQTAKAEQRPGWDLLPSHPCREIISQASDASLLEWWQTYGMGTVAWAYRDVPRRRILHQLNRRHIQPYEHPGR